MGAILKVKDDQGNWVAIPYIKGDQGDTGPQGPQGIQGPQGETGDTGVGILTIQDNGDGTITVEMTDGTEYTFSLPKGDTGDPGPAADVEASTIAYQASASGTTIPTGTWTTTIPTVTQGQYLWSRTTIEWNDGSTSELYSVGYMGVDGSAGGGDMLAADYDPNGVVALAGGIVAYVTAGLATKAAASHTHAQSDVTNLVSDLAGKAAASHTHAQSDVTGLASALSTINTAITAKALYFASVTVTATTGDIVTLSNSAITADHVVASIEFADPSAIMPGCAWTTSAGELVLTGTCTSATTANITLIKKDN